MKRLSIASLLLLAVSVSFSRATGQNQPSVYQDTVTASAFRNYLLLLELKEVTASLDTIPNLFAAGIGILKDGNLDTSEILRFYTASRVLIMQDNRRQKLPNEKTKLVLLQLDRRLGDLLEYNQNQSMYRDRFRADTANQAGLRELTATLSGKHLEGSDFYLRVAKHLYDLDTTPEHAYLQSLHFLRKGFYNFAQPLLRKAELSADTLISAAASAHLAEIYYYFNWLQQAREYALKSARTNRSSGLPYRIIGDCYANSYRTCEGNDLERAGVFWAAADQYERAGKLDKRLEAVIRQRSAVVGGLFPDRRTLEKNEIKPGDTWQVGCWINEATTARAKSGK